MNKLNKSILTSLIIISGTSTSTSGNLSDLVTSDIEEVVAACQIFYSNTNISDACLEMMDRYFLKQPIWNTYRLYNHTETGRLRYSGTELNKRNRLIYPISHADYYSISFLPKWKDIFDSDISSRTQLVAKVFHKNECRKLLTSSNIRKDMSEGHLY